MLALGTRQRILLARFRMQEDREIPPHGFVTGGDKDFRRCPDDNPVAVGDATIEEFIADRAAHAIDFHRLRNGGGSRHSRTLAW